MNTKTYQLTSHPVGTVGEIWAMSWPLMISLISTGCMMFVDRLMLSHHSVAELNAVATSGMAFWMFLVMPITITAISEVLVGRLHGEGSFSKTGQAALQMAYFSFMLLPVFGAISYFFPKILFYKSLNEAYETSYFQTMMLFASFPCASVAVSGFFIGIGKVKSVVFATVLANCMNALLGYLFIFGIGPIPSMGIVGASYATVVAQVFQLALLLCFFLKRMHRETFGTSRFGLDLRCLKEGIHIGFPVGLGKAVEVLAHFLFFRILMLAGEMHLTLAVLAGTMYIPISFFIEAIEKGTASITANLLGAEKRELVGKVFHSSLKLHVIFFTIFSICILSFPEFILKVFLAKEDVAFLHNPEFLATFYACAIAVCLFYLFDGCQWILMGMLTAAGDTKFILYVSSIINWLGYVLPTYWVVHYLHKGADWAWGVIASYTLIISLIYYWRYHSGKWLIYWKK